MEKCLTKLTVAQREVLGNRMPHISIVREHSWGIVGTTVLEVRDGDGGHFIIKAGDANDHHLAREIAAHRRWLDVWTQRSRAPRLRWADEHVKLLVTEYLPGDLVQGLDAEWHPDAYRQAGELLYAFHQQCTVIDDGEYERLQRDKILASLDRPHRIAPDVASRLRDLVGGWPTPPSTLVPTHGDWQPRNWLIHSGVVSVIDFGRTLLRPADTDFTRLVAQQFRTDPALAQAFLEGYGPDPREPAAWSRSQMAEAVGTAVWAHQVGDEAFEAQGHRMIADALEATGA